MDVNRYIPPLPYVTWDAEMEAHLNDPVKCVTMMFDAYLECAEWADKPEDAPDEWDGCWFSASTMDMAWFECCAFLHLARWHIKDWSMVQLGHDFWLTRNGHGAGFWDRDFGTEESREALSALARQFGSAYLFMQDGELHIERG